MSFDWSRPVRDSDLFIESSYIMVTKKEYDEIVKSLDEGREGCVAAKT